MRLCKRSIRHHAIFKRDGLPLEWRERASLKIAEILRHSGLCLNHALIAGYIPLGSEADPRPAMHTLAQSGALLCLPFTHKSSLSYHCYVFGDPLVESGFGTKAPDSSTANLRPDVLLVPLVAFDATGARIGWGKGFYDRSILELKADGKPLLTIGVAFGCQQVSFIPVEAHDRPLDYVATEMGMIRCWPFA